MFITYLKKTHLRSILRKTAGVRFLGTPHRGSPTATLGKVAFEASKISLTSTKIRILRALEVNSESLENISNEFNRILVDKKVPYLLFPRRIPHYRCTGCHPCLL